MVLTTGSRWEVRLCVSLMQRQILRLGNLAAANEAYQTAIEAAFAGQGASSAAIYLAQPRVFPLTVADGLQKMITQIHCLLVILND